MTIELKKSKKSAAIDLSGPEGKLCIAAVLGAFYTTAWIALEPVPTAASVAQVSAAQVSAAQVSAAPAIEAPKSALKGAPMFVRPPAPRRVRIRTRSS